jgi:hypothetical protein
MPWELTRAVPSEVEPVFTVVADALVVWDAGFAFEAVVVLVLELLPQAANSSEAAARDGRVSLARNRICHFRSDGSNGPEVSSSGRS